ncbi:50S ribosomal protein L1 [candidate division Kazan bacterium RIFCSPHIGHO2_01_FULL_49_10]|uniref:Large ribosomal subunit protein uL1 n=1 Tax=candidate division Kazan bacterium RIFCSPLOWO2_01_FULL_48_13 TaxID=1798539 RepID=A0A1F4PQZ2_UNCK3|nr:MAG: 50S ribosomal protein L1 [candidate division Kazan bacterium RIFCSPHIGHO2_01_FULL_49_10]OGB85462.1 MAG: 50S ribosomal protein L1 [candidate division Kazan bacterium RIFCSPLOWO2_01_FULL_48_13]
MEKRGRGKKYLEAIKLVDRAKLYPIGEAIDLLVATSPVKFDATAEAHIQTGLDPKQAEQNIRGTVAMPAGLGKNTTILVFAEGAAATEAKKAGANFVGSEDLIEKIKNGWLGFDVAIAEPSMMVKIGKIGKILGTKGLMPNPKTGTVTKEVAKVVEEFKKGKVEFRLDKDAIIHMGFGKISLKQDGLMSNFTALFKALSHARPASAKGTYLQKVVLASTMGPGIRVDLSSLA